MHTSDFLAFLVLIAGAAVSAVSKKLTPAAAFTGGLLGVAIYAGSGWSGLLLLALFFITGTVATSWRKKDKLLITGAASHQPTRRPGQVIANAGTAAISGLLAILIPACKPLFFLMMAAGFSSAMADTLSSELGMVYGRRFVNILTWRPDQRGLDGVISMEGLSIGIAGSTLIAVAYGLTAGWDLRRMSVIVVAGTIGNLADSLLGALFERRGQLSNDAVNFFNTFIAAGCAAALMGFRC
jgi:uncharacterized protein (TIGR00297 family)